MKGCEGKTVIELCKTDPEYQLELKNLLDEATKRDGQILYEFGDPDILSVQGGKVRMPDLGAALRAFGPYSFRYNIEFEKGMEYHCWLRQKNKELDAQYNAMRRAWKRQHHDALTNSDVQPNDSYT